METRQKDWNVCIEIEKNDKFGFIPFSMTACFTQRIISYSKMAERAVMLPAFASIQAFLSLYQGLPKIADFT